MKNLKDILSFLKSKYTQVKIYKNIKKHNLVLKIFECKNTKTFYYVAAFDKKNNVRSIDSEKELIKISKKNIPIMLRSFFNAIQNIEQKEKTKKIQQNTNEVLKYQKNGTKIKNKKKKEAPKIGLRYKGKKLDDLIFLWGILRMTLTYADEAKDRFKFEKTLTGYLKLTTNGTNNDDKLICDLYFKLAMMFRQLKIFDGTLEAEYLDKMFEKNYKISAEKLQKRAKDKAYYIDIYIPLYMLQLWKEQVNFKSFDIRIDYNIFYKTLEIIYDRYENDKHNALENTEYFAEELYHLVYSKYNWFMKLHK